MAQATALRYQPPRGADQLEREADEVPPQRLHLTGAPVHRAGVDRAQRSAAQRGAGRGGARLRTQASAFLGEAIG
jgi:hypothetical protein